MKWINRLWTWAVWAVIALVAYQVMWALARLVGRDVQRSLSQPPDLGGPKTYEKSQEFPAYTRIHTVQGGIERIDYLPKTRRFETPILMQHGMWHGAWTWDTWGPLFAEWGWEVHTHSLPGHAGSPAQMPIEACTLDEYLRFFKAEIDRLDRPPVLIGHSMGGMLTQWYLKHVGKLPAVVLAAPWPYSAWVGNQVPHFILADVPGMLLSVFSRRAEHCRTPARAARALLSVDSVITPQAFHAQLGPESMLVLMQYLFFWRAPQAVDVPMLVVAGEADAVVSEASLRLTAEHYGAEYILCPQAGHNMMYDRRYVEIAQQIHDWLAAGPVD